MDLDWIVPEQIAALSMPGRGELLRLRKLGVTLLVTLVEEKRPGPELVLAAGLRRLHLPVANWRAPQQEQIREFVAEARAELARGGKVAVHCLGGIGRTGTMIACYLVSEGWDPEEAIAEVRRRRPGSIETREQESAIYAWWGEQQRPADSAARSGAEREASAPSPENLS